MMSIKVEPGVECLDCSITTERFHWETPGPVPVQPPVHVTLWMLDLGCWLRIFNLNNTIILFQDAFLKFVARAKTLGYGETSRLSASVYLVSTWRPPKAFFGNTSLSAFLCFLPVHVTYHQQCLLFVVTGDCIVPVSVHL
jgi:hypothetical protein